MISIMSEKSDIVASPTKQRKAQGVLACLFFMWGFCTVLNDVLVPHLKAVFDMNYVETMLIQFTFFGAYLVLSLPAAKLIERIGYKRAIMVGLAIMAVGCLLFLPAAQSPSYRAFLVALFALAAGMTVLQVAANPYVALLGQEKTAAARLNLAQGFNSVGTLMAPWLGGILILSQTKAGHIVGGALESLSDRMMDARVVQVPYLCIAMVLVGILALIWMAKLPNLTTEAEERASGTGTGLFRHKMLVMGTMAIFVYVGGEVSIGSFMINYFASPHIGHMTTAMAAGYLSFYWGGAALGRFVGALAMRFLPPSKILADNCVAAVFLIALSMAAHGPLAMWGLLLVGLCNSIMFPTIFTLAIKGLGPLTGRGSGFLVMAICGGAVVPVVQAAVADMAGLTVSFLVPLACYIFIWLFAMQNYEGQPEGAVSA